MTQQGSGSTPSEIQFDHAELATPAEQVCIGCKKAVENIYYTVNKRIVCAKCRDGYFAQLSSGSKTGRLLRATVYGLGAGILGAIIWFAVRKITDYELALIAILVGYMVGMAVRKGSGGRGGVPYQLLAVVLTYSCIVSQYVPDVFTGFRDYAHTHKSASAATLSTAPSAANSSTATTPAAASASDEKPDKSFKDMPMAKKIGLLALFAAILFGIAFVAPVMMGMEHPIGLLIIAFGLWQAWKMNRARAVVFTGPHTMAAPAGA